MQAINWSWCLWFARPSPLRSFVVQLPHERKPPLPRGSQPCPERLRGGVLWPPLCGHAQRRPQPCYRQSALARPYQHPLWPLVPV